MQVKHVMQYKMHVGQAGKYVVVTITRIGWHTVRRLDTSALPVIIKKLDQQQELPAEASQWRI